MGRKAAGSTLRTKLIAFRLNDEEDADRVQKMQARSITDVSAYYRTLQDEDEGSR